MPTGSQTTDAPTQDTSHVSTGQQNVAKPVEDGAGSATPDYLQQRRQQTFGQGQQQVAVNSPENQAQSAVPQPGVTSQETQQFMLVPQTQVTDQPPSAAAAWHETQTSASSNSS